MNPDALAELEDERRHLLRSLRDLDAERAAGDVEADDYVTLRDGYTKRAADVLRQIEIGQAARRRGPQRRLGRSVAVALAVVLVAAGLGWWVARSAGQRTAGQQITGADPRDRVAQLLSQARSALDSDQLRAIELYEQVLAEDPDQPEALTYSAWLAYLTSRQLADEAARASAVDSVLPTLERAIASDPTYADPHCFLGIIGLNEQRGEAAARAELERCLALDPPVAARSLVEQFLAATDAATTVPMSVPPTSVAG